MEKDVDFDISKYKYVVLDFDGTVYSLFPVKFCLGIWMILYYLFHPLLIKEFFCVLAYRRLLDRFIGVSFSKNTRQVLCRRLAIEYGLHEEEVNALLVKWMEEKPCVFIKIFQRTNFLTKLIELQKRDIKIILYSDNPIKIKKNAILLIADYWFDAFDEGVCCIKPCPNGLFHILNKLKIKPNEILYIGDRVDRDGLCAKNAGVDFMLYSEFGGYEF